MTCHKGLEKNSDACCKQPCESPKRLPWTHSYFAYFAPSALWGKPVCSDSNGYVQLVTWSLFSTDTERVRVASPLYLATHLSRKLFCKNAWSVLLQYIHVFTRQQCTCWALKESFRKTVASLKRKRGNRTGFVEPKCPDAAARPESGQVFTQQSQHLVNEIFKPVVLYRGVPMHFQGGANPCSLCNMGSLINMFTNKYICFHNLFIVRGLETKDNYLRESISRKITHPQPLVHTWIEVCASLNHRKKTKADGSGLIPRKHTETRVLLSVFKGGVEEKRLRTHALKRKKGLL